MGTSKKYQVGAAQLTKRDARTVVRAVQDQAQANQSDFPRMKELNRLRRMLGLGKGSVQIVVPYNAAAMNDLQGRLKLLRRTFLQSDGGLLTESDVHRLVPYGLNPVMLATFLENPLPGEQMTIPAGMVGSFLRQFVQELGVASSQAMLVPKDLHASPGTIMDLLAPDRGSAGFTDATGRFLPPGQSRFFARDLVAGDRVLILDIGTQPFER